ncbi:hypothetical protein OYE22_14935 [Streptomyces sp. 71268]|uniref:hypothetical protein n=1 Tax=Streptomyces sp. 71268 TaxID=3002640 RepID=UPI0023F66F0E|nr:hypothetical protein [Streptomyces sp. 71268]WEV26345.1 hypothetical protein OYE22_14935 [Streptomyces sp. 71268]
MRKPEGVGAGRGVVVALVLVLVTAGCSSSDDPPDARREGGERTSSVTTTPPGGQPTGTDGPTPGATRFTPAPERLPHDRAGALRLARAVSVEPASFGADFARHASYESADTTWAVLDDGCVWQRERLPAEVLASLTRRSVLPARAGRGAVDARTVVTVHRDVYGADREMAATLEEVLRCPRQRLNADETIGELTSTSSLWGERGQATADDLIWERGSYRGRLAGGPHPYSWATARIGPLTLTVTVKGGTGHADDALTGMLQKPLVELVQRTREALS